MSVSSLVAEAIPELLQWSFELLAAAGRGVQFLLSPRYRRDVRERWGKEGRLVMWFEILGVIVVWILWIAGGAAIYLALTG